MTLAWRRRIGIGRGVVAQPGRQLLKAQLICVVEAGEELDRFLRVRIQTHSVDGQENVPGRESGPLVAIDKRMVLRKALPKRGSFLNQIGVVPGLRPVKSGFQQPGIADAVRAAVALNQVGVQGEYFGKGKKLAHSASFL